MTQNPPPPTAVVVPDDLEAGVYANGVSLWHTPTEFVLDFFTFVPGVVPVTQPDGSTTTAQKLRVVSRVKLPPPQIFELMKALERQLSDFEAAQEGAGVEQPLYPPFAPGDGAEGGPVDA